MCCPATASLKRKHATPDPPYFTNSTIPPTAWGTRLPGRCRWIWHGIEYHREQFGPGPVSPICRVLKEGHFSPLAPMTDMEGEGISWWLGADTRENLEEISRVAADGWRWSRGVWVWPLTRKSLTRGLWHDTLLPLQKGFLMKISIKTPWFRGYSHLSRLSLSP